MNHVSIKIFRLRRQTHVLACSISTRPSASPSSGRHTHISEFNIYDDIYRLNPTTTSTVNPSTICKNSCDKLWILQAYYMIKLFIFKLTSVIPHQFWMMVLGLTSPLIHLVLGCIRFWWIEIWRRRPLHPFWFRFWKWTIFFIVV